VSAVTGELQTTGMRECELLARSEGLAAGLGLALHGVDVLAVAPGRWAAVPAGLAPIGAETRTHRLADPEGIVFVACPGDRPHAASCLLATGRLLAAVRLGLVRRLLDLAVEHLAGRTTGGEPLLGKQLLSGDIADVIAEVELLRVYAQCQHDLAAMAELHRQLDNLGWQVTKLFGAIGYLADYPVRALYVAVLVANTWIAGEAAQ
jgi:alkylation response protein AidB-like acyl-CoA dehydrogenase